MRTFLGYQGVCKKDTRKSDILISSVIALLDLLVGENIENKVESGLGSVNDIKVYDLCVYVCVSPKTVIHLYPYSCHKNTRSFPSPLFLLPTELRVVEPFQSLSHRATCNTVLDLST